MKLAIAVIKCSSDGLIKTIIEEVSDQLYLDKQRLLHFLADKAFCKDDDIQQIIIVEQGNRHLEYEKIFFDRMAV